MDRRLSRRLTLFIACLAGGGCAETVPLREGNAPLLEAIAPVVDGLTSPPPQAPIPTNVQSPYLNADTIAAGPQSPEAYAMDVGAPRPAPTGVAAASPGDPAALQKIMAELQSLGTVDPDTQRQLLADLQQTDPALWPMLMQTFRAGMTYRQKQATPPPSTVAAVGPSTTSERPPAAAPTTSEPTARPDPVPAKVSAVGASAAPPLDTTALTTGPRGAAHSPGLSFPATTLLDAALAEAQRREAAPEETPPPKATTGDVRPATHERTVDVVAAQAEVDWQKAIGEAIVALERETAEPPHSAHEVTRHAWLRVLYLAADRRDDALRPIPGIAAVEQDYWSEQLYALATYLDTEKLTDPARRSAEAARHLSIAAGRLSEAGTLTVKNLAFCTEVSSYGVYQKFKGDEFKANQPLILYAEIENFKSDDTPKGFHTALRSSYQILDAQGRRVAENDLALTEEYCQNLRRDYFLRYFLSVPERIYAGKYTLQLTIVDTLSQKIGQSSIEFTVVEK